MTFGPPTGDREAAERDARQVIDALRRTEGRLLDELAEQAGAKDDAEGADAALEGIGNRFEDLSKRIQTVPETLADQYRDVLPRFLRQLGELRQDLRSYTLMMNIAVALTILLLLVLLMFRRG